jgi:hypothetical protein
MTEETKASGYDRTRETLFAVLASAPAETLVEFVKLCGTIRRDNAMRPVEIDGQTAWVMSLASMIVMQQFLDQRDESNAVAPQWEEP